MLTNRSIFRPDNLLSLFIRISRKFIKNDKGAILLPFIIILPFFIALLFLSFEISQLLQKKAKLSDAIEQATLALTVENDDLPDELQMRKNVDLVSNFSSAYLPLEHFSVPEIDIKNNCGQLTYNAKITMSYFANFLSKTAMTNTITTIGTEDNGAAIKQVSTIQDKATDVIFVADYSGSMNEGFHGKVPRGEKINALRDVFNRLNGSILKNSNINLIGFVPFSWGTKRIVIENNQEKKYCHFPFVPKLYRADNNYFRQYTVSGLKKFPGLEGLTDIDKINYGELTLGEYNTLTNVIKNMAKQEYRNKALEFLRITLNIPTYMQQMIFITTTIDYDATIKSINSDAQYIDIPLDDIINESICLNNSNAYSLDSHNSHDDLIDKMIAMSPLGQTLVSSGILYANTLFKKESNNSNNKLMVIISDGIDVFINDTTIQQSIYISKTLIDKGMCERIKENNIKMVFIAIKDGSNETNEPANYIDWKKCVGEDNYYYVSDAHELEAALRQSLTTTSSEVVGRNIPKH